MDHTFPLKPLHWSSGSTWPQIGFIPSARGQLKTKPDTETKSKTKSLMIFVELCFWYWRVTGSRENEENATNCKLTPHNREENKQKLRRHNMFRRCFKSSLGIASIFHRRSHKCSDSFIAYIWHTTGAFRHPGSSVSQTPEFWATGKLCRNTANDMRPMLLHTQKRALGFQSEFFFKRKVCNQRWT